MGEHFNNRIYIVIAAYNEAGPIRGVVSKLLETYPNVVVVDDGSQDGTSDVLAGMQVYLLRHIINRGQGAALQTGITLALEKGAEVIVTFDADGQHDPVDIASLVSPIISGDCDVTLGSRFLGQAQNIPYTRMLLLKAGILFTRAVSGIRVTDVHNGLRAFSRDAAGKIQVRLDRMGHASELLDQIIVLGLRYQEVPVTVYYSEYSLSKGQSSWNALRIAIQFLAQKVSSW